MSDNPSSAAFFEQRYQRDGDHWGFATNPYERNRYRTLLQIIGPRPFARAYEPGCSIGVFTELLAHRSTSLLATDPSPTAVAAAAERCARHPHVQVAVGSLPGDLDPTNGGPFTTGAPGPFDLIVFSEVGYYFDVPTLAVTIDRLCHALLPHGILVGTHWSGHSADHRLHADEVHSIINAHTGLKKEREERHPGFLLGRWRRRERPNAT